jgi:hypothetical protein
MEEEILKALQANTVAVNELITGLQKGDFNFGNQQTQGTPGNLPGIGKLLSGGFTGATKALEQFSGVARNSSGDLSRSVSDVAKLFPAQVGALSQPLANLAQTSFEVNQNLRQFGIDLGDNIFDVQKFGDSLNLTDQELARFMQQNGQIFAQMGTDATSAFEGFAKFRDIMDESDIEEKMLALGMGFDEINQYVADQLKMQGISDLQDEAAMRRRAQDMLLFRQATQEFAEVTGRSAEEAARQADELAKTQGAYSYELRNGREAANALSRALADMGMEQFADFAYRGFNVAAAADPMTAALMGDVLKDLDRYQQEIAQTGGQRDFMFEAELMQRAAERSAGYLADPAMTLIEGTNKTLEFANSEAMRAVGRQENFDGTLESLARLVEANAILTDQMAELDALKSQGRITDEAYKMQADQIAKAYTDATGLSPEDGTTRASMLTVKDSLADVSGSMRALASTLDSENSIFRAGLKDLSDVIFSIERGINTFKDPSLTPEAVQREEETLATNIENLDIAREQGLITQEQYNEALQNLLGDKPIPVDVVKYLGSTQRTGINSGELQTTDDGPLQNPSIVIEDIKDIVPNFIKQAIQGPLDFLELDGIQNETNKLKSQTQENNLPSDNNQSSITNEKLDKLIEINLANGEKMAELKPAILDSGNKTAGAMGSAAFSLAEQSRTNNLSSSIAKSTGVLTSASA